MDDYSTFDLFKATSTFLATYAVLVGATEDLRLVPVFFLFVLIGMLKVLVVDGFN